MSNESIVRQQKQSQGRLLSPTEMIQFDSPALANNHSVSATMLSRLDEEFEVLKVSQFLEQVESLSANRIIGVKGYVEYVGEGEVILEPVIWPWENLEGFAPQPSMPSKCYFYRLHENADPDTELSVMFCCKERLINREHVIVPHCMCWNESIDGS